MSLTCGEQTWPAWLRHSILINVSFLVFLSNMYTAGYDTRIVRTNETVLIPDSITTGFVELAMEFRVGFDELQDLISCKQSLHVVNTQC